VRKYAKLFATRTAQQQYAKLFATSTAQNMQLILVTASQCNFGLCKYWVCVRDTVKQPLHTTCVHVTCMHARAHKSDYFFALSLCINITAISTHDLCGGLL